MTSYSFVVLSIKVQQKTKKIYANESGCFDPATHHVQHGGLAEDVLPYENNTHIITIPPNKMWLLLTPWK